MVTYDSSFNHSNVKLNESKGYNKLLLAFENQNELFDKNIKQLFNETLYINNPNSSKIAELKDAYSNNNISDICDNFIDLLNNNVNLQISMINNINNKSKVLGNTYNYNVDMYRNQKNMNEIVSEEKNSLEKRNYKYLEGVVNDKKQIEIYNYYYQKNKTQQNILYYLFIVCVIVIILTYINIHFNVFLTDTIYSIIVGIIGSLYIIYFIYSFYDILIRDNTNFNEYDFMWGKSKLPHSSKGSYDLLVKDQALNNDKKCDVYKELMK